VLEVRRKKLKGVELTDETGAVLKKKISMYLSRALWLEDVSVAMRSSYIVVGLGKSKGEYIFS